MNSNPYEILGVASSASQDEVRDAYRKLAKKYHPDLNPGNKDAEKRFKDIAGAYELIGSAESRAKFDRGEFDQDRGGPSSERAQGRHGPFYHQTQRDGGRYSSFHGGMDDDLLRSIFGQMGGSDGGFGFSGDVPGQDMLFQLNIDFKDAVLGAESEITLPSGKRLRVKIPAGVDSGAKLRFPGLGSPGTGKAPAGDVYVQLNVKSSPLFKRQGNDLEIELPISLSEAVLGGDVKVPTIEGSVMLKVPAGVSSGTRLRISGKGVAGSGKRGDEFVVLKIVSPSSVDADFKQAVEAWSKRQNFNPRESWIGAKGGAV